MRASKASGAVRPLASVAAGAAGYLMGRRGRGSRLVPPTPHTREPPAFDPGMIRRAPPVKLNAHSIDAFVRWVAGMPISDAQAVRDAIGAARADDETARELIARLFELPVRDLGQRQLLLSVIGELRRPEFVEPLMRFIELPSEGIVGPLPDGPPCGVGTSYFDGAWLLKARAVEMLAYLRTDAALRATLDIASNHDSRAVRLSALDAYTFNHDDSPEALERARANARRDEAKFVGLPRRTRDSDPAELEERVAAFYERYPEERPPGPQATKRGAPGPSPAQRVSG